MAHSDGTSSPNLASLSPASTISEVRWPSSAQKDEKTVNDDDVVQGRIFWLPPKHELPTKAVRRAHGKGAVEEGIYNHPVVVISRPSEETNIVHFHLITSFQGKKLHEIYGKANEFHSSRRSWYLPISPAPDHPDATSKKSKKRFPTLDLASGAVLRWDSYVNLRHVYKIDWTHLRPYNNPDMPWNMQYRFERESMIRMLAKGRVLTTYEPGKQLQKPVPVTSVPRYHNQAPDQESQVLLSPKWSRTSTMSSEGSNQSTPQKLEALVSPRWSRTSTMSSEGSNQSTPQQSDFLDSTQEIERSMRRPPRAPPDDNNSGCGEIVQQVFRCLLEWTWTVLKRLWSRVRS